MTAVIGWILLLAPILKTLLTKVLPKLVSKIRGIGGKLTGNAAGLGGGTLVLSDLALGETLKTQGVFAAMYLLLTRIWGFLTRFPNFLKGLFAVGGVLHFIRPVMMYFLGLFKTPVLVFIALLTSAYFPTIIEKFFLVVGSIALKIFVVFFKAGKSAFSKAVENMGEGGDNVVDQFRDSILSSFDALPHCFVDVMGYIHFLEDLGMIISTATLVLTVSVFRHVYGGFVTDKKII